MSDEDLQRNTFERNSSTTTAASFLYSGNINSSEINHTGGTIDNSNMYDSNIPIQQQPIMMPIQINRVIASTTLLRPRKSGELLPIEYEPTNLDVCSGRGKRNWTHSGNIAFRELIQHTTPAYMAAPTKNEKTAIVCNIVEEMRALGCQFLKQDSTTNRWYDMGDAQARDKVGHSLRDQVSAYNRSQITPAQPITFEHIVGMNYMRASITPPGGAKQHARRPSLAMSDSGNEADERRMSLDTTSIHGEFARRPSWIADSDTTILTDIAVMEGLAPSEHGKLDDVVGDIPVISTPARSPLSSQTRRISTWDFIDTYDFYVDQDIDPGAGKDAKYLAMLKALQSSDATPIQRPIVSADLTSPKPELDSTAKTPAVEVSVNCSHPFLQSDNKEIQQSITMTDVMNWNPKLSKQQIEKMLQDSVQTWDPKSSSIGDMSGILTKRRSAMSGGTTIRRLSHSLKMTERSIDSLFGSCMDFGESQISLNYEPPTVTAQSHIDFEPPNLRAQISASFLAKGNIDELLDLTVD